MAAADGLSMDDWTNKYAQSITDLRQFYSPDLHYRDSAERLRKLLTQGILRQTDIRYTHASLLCSSDICFASGIVRSDSSKLTAPSQNMPR